MSPRKEAASKNKPSMRGFYFRRKKIIKITVLLLLLALVYWKYFIYIDIKNNCIITIKPSFLEFSNSMIKRSILVIKYALPDDYRNLCKHVNSINPNISCGGFQGGCYSQYKNHKPKEIDIGTSNRSLQWTVPVIMHETCHAMQFQQNREFSEEECHAHDGEVLGKITEF